MYASRNAICVCVFIHVRAIEAFWTQPLAAKVEASTWDLCAELHTGTGQLQPPAEQLHQWLHGPLNEGLSLCIEFCILLDISTDSVWKNRSLESYCHLVAQSLREQAWWLRHQKRLPKDRKQANLQQSLTNTIRWCLSKFTFGSTLLRKWCEYDEICNMLGRGRRRSMLFHVLGYSKHGTSKQGNQKDHGAAMPSLGDASFGCLALCIRSFITAPK